MKPFKEALEEATIYEDLVADWLQSRGNKILFRSKEKEFDIQYLTADSKTKTAEVKYDKLSSKTGNVAIEFKRKNKKSEEFEATGISVTTANYWIHIVDEFDVYIIDREILLMQIQSNRYPQVFGGDDMRTKMHLIDKQEFAEMCKVHKNVLYGGLV